MVKKIEINLTLGQRYKSELRDFVQTTSFHGPGKIFQTQNIFWLILFLCLSSYTVYSIKGYISSYLEYPVVTNSDIVSDGKPLFPTIRVCYYNKSAPVRVGLKGMPLSSDETVQITSMCTEFNSGFNSTGHKIEIHRLTDSSIYFGFTLYLYGVREGTTLFITEPYAKADRLRPISISRGAVTNLILNRVYMHRLPSPYSNCQSEVTVKNVTKYKPVYKQRPCIYLCMQKLYAEHCGVSLDEFSSFAHDYYDDELIFENLMREKVYAKCDIRSLQEMDRKTKNEGLLKLCGADCPQECSSLTYTIQSHVSNSNNFQADYESGLANINIYFETFDYTNITQVAKITAENLFGNLGGAFGLLLGASIMSFAEIIEVIIRLLYLPVKHQLEKKKNKITVKVKPRERTTKANDEIVEDCY